MVKVSTQTVMPQKRRGSLGLEGTAWGGWSHTRDGDSHTGTKAVPWAVTSFLLLALAGRGVGEQK